MTIRKQVKDHLESILGTAALDTGASEPGASGPAPFRVATYLDQPVDGAATLVTLGLSEAPLRGPESELVRQELLFCAWERFRRDDLYQTLFSVAQWVHDSGETANPGAVFELPQPVAHGTRFRHLFFYLPIYHPDALQPVPLDGDRVEVLWLIPITEAEAVFVEENGPEAFDQLLEKSDPDLLDLDRASVV